MIRALQKADIDSVAEIWLDTNRKAHAFIPASYWERNFASVKEMLPQAEVCVYETENGIQGFLGLSGEYIEGLFVSEEAQSHGIGKCLLDCAKDRKPALRLNVYQKNVRAIRFTDGRGFRSGAAGWMRPPANRTMKCCGSGSRDSGLPPCRERAKSEVVVKEVYNGVLDFYVDYGFASSIYDDWFWKIFYEKGSKGNKFSIWISDFDVYEEQRHMGICS